MRPIRSYVRREGRITPAQSRALAELLPRYALPAEGAIDVDAAFAATGPLWVEIGFGNGESLAALAAARPDHRFIGIEMHRPGVGSLLRRLDADDLDNVRVVVADAVGVLARLPEHSIDACLILFPDPWPKKRHHKRRLVDRPFVALVASRLADGGRLHVATDWKDYAEAMREVLEAEPLLVNAAGRGHYAERPDYRVRTRYERRGEGLGQPARDLVFARVSGLPDPVTKEAHADE